MSVTHIHLHFGAANLPVPPLDPGHDPGPATCNLTRARLVLRDFAALARLPVETQRDIWRVNAQIIRTHRPGPILRPIGGGDAA